MKNRKKNHWDGLNNFEKLVQIYKVDPDGFNSNCISIDRIESIQEIIFQIKKLLSISPIINIGSDLEDIKKEFNFLIGCIRDIQDDFQMHIDDLDFEFKKFVVDYDSSQLKEKDIKESLMNNQINIDKEKTETSSASSFLVLKKIDKSIELESHRLVQKSSDQIELIEWKKHAEKMCCEGTNLIYLNEKNKDFFYKILSRLENSTNVQFQEIKKNDSMKIFAYLINNPTFEEVGYLLEMRKYGLGIKII